jgi:hypothetical protein
MTTSRKIKASATLISQNHNETLVADGIGGVNGNGTAGIILTDKETPVSKSSQGLKVKTNLKAGVGDPGI